MKQVLALLVAAIILFGCVNISDAAKAGSFGKKASEQKAYDYFKNKYGSPEGTGSPRFIEPLMTTFIDSDFMPADKVLKYNKDVPAFYVWFFYDNFAESDAITVTFRYLEDGTDIYTFNSKGGGDFGAANFKLAKPDDGWPLGKYEVVISGRGVTEKVPFEVIEGATVKIALPYESGAAAPAAPVVGGDKDEYGCIGSAGYTWCAELNKCIRSWEEECKAPSAEPATTAGMTSDSIIFETDPGYIGACDLTDKAEWTLSSPLEISVFQVWYNWGAGESTLAFKLEKDDESFAEGTLVRADCDPYQGNWCNGNIKLDRTFAAGKYELKLPSAKMCLEPGKTGAVRLYGKASTAAAPSGAAGGATSPALPSDVPAHLSSCSYTGEWSTDWGTMELEQEGSKVTGTYTHDSGKLEGTLVDGVYVGKWSEYPSYSEPGDGGDMVFYFTKDCSSFSGTWQYGVHPDGAGWSGTWVGTKSS